jgi:hypothetical protein
MLDNLALAVLAEAGTIVIPRLDKPEQAAAVVALFGSTFK